MTRPFVGNDVVDLTDPRMAGRAANRRFLERVLTLGEWAYVEAGAGPDACDRRLWALWACKEAAYKVASKVRGSPPTFIHAAFQVKVEADGTDEACGWVGQVRWKELTVAVTVHAGQGVLHAVAAPAEGPPPAGWRLVRLDEPGAPWAAPLEALLPRFTEAERDAIHARPSAAVRLGARAELAGALDVPEGRLEIICPPGPAGRRPPGVFLDGAPAPVDVSLSHHGAWIGWAWGVPEGG